MKILILSLLICIFSNTVFAKNGEPDSKAIYIVPTLPEYVEYSRFEVKIIKPYMGDYTQTIAYVFPEILTGDPNLVLEFKRIPGTKNNWENDQMLAHCTTLGDSFSCNISFKRDKTTQWINWHRMLIPMAVASPVSLSKEKSISHLSAMGLTGEPLMAFSNVIDEWFSNEPGGILVYDFQ